MEFVTLNNGIKMPMLGYGTYLISDSDAENLVGKAISIGYRLIDSAKYYNNEIGIGKAVKNCGLKREELFITTKVYSSGYENTKMQIENSLKKLDMSYIDLMLIHWPVDDNVGTYRALEEYYKLGKIKAIGVSNFNSEQIEEILDNCEIPSAVNQIETHIYLQQKKLHKIMQDKGILHQAWSPFAEGYLNVFQDKTISKIAKKYNKTPAQIILRFLIESSICVIPKSSREDRMKENFDIFDFSLLNEDKKAIEELDIKKSATGWPSSMRKDLNY